MAKKTINITIDTMQAQYSTIGTFKQLDSVFFNVQITEQGIAKDLTGQTLKLYVNKADKKVVEQKTGITIVDAKTGKITIDLLNAALQSEGFAVAELNISDSTGSISTVNFNFRVAPTVASDNFIESSNEISTLKEVELYVIQAKKEIQDFKKLQTEMTTLNNAMKINEEDRKTSELDRVEAERIREERFEEMEGSSQLSEITQEIKEARSDYWGKTYESLKAKEDAEFQFQHVDNSKGMFLEQKGQGSLTVKNTLEGAVKDLKILGNTVGGYNPELSTSFPLQSVAEAENGLIVAKTCGKQQWDIEEWKKNKSYKCKAFANTKYRQSMGYQQVATVFYDKDKRRISDTYDATFTTPINCKFIAFGGGCLNPNDINHDRFLKIMLTLGDNISTDYEPYQESVVQVQLPFEEGLKSVSNSICDKIQSSNVTQKIGQHIFNGTENFRSFVKNTNTSYSTFDLDNVKGGSASPMKCNRLPHMHSFEDVAHIHSNRNQLTLTLNNSEMDSVDLIGFKNLIKKYSDSNEPIIVQYELAEPIIHEIPTQKLSTFKTLTTLTVETEVEADVEGEFPVDLGGVLTDLQQENKILREENILFKETFNKKLEEVDFKFARLFNAKN